MTRSDVVQAPHSARDRLVAEAERVFRERGYTAATVGEVLKRAGLSKGAFYHHFESKEQMFAEVLEQVAQRAIDRAEAIFTETTDSAERFVRLTADVVEDIATNGARVFNEPTELFDTALFTHAVELRRRYQRYFVDLVDQMQREGLARTDVPATIVVKGVLGMAMSTTDWFRPGGRLTAGQLGRTFAGFVAFGLANAGPIDGPREPPKARRIRRSASRR